jgi:hypothetical protein
MIELRFRFDAALRERPARVGVTHAGAVEPNKLHDQERSDEPTHPASYQPVARLSRRRPLLIINADDFGMCHAANAAIARSLTDGVVRSMTLMVPCAWALHAMQWLAALVSEYDSVRAKPRLRRRRLSRPATLKTFR